MNPPQVYVYVDGESHYIRSQECWQKLHGKDARLESIARSDGSSKEGIYHDAAGKLFWDTTLLQRHKTPNGTYPPTRQVYFTAASGDDDALHRLRTMIRNAEMEPHVIKEMRTLQQQRENYLKQSGIIEKPKAVDIGLTVRMLEDAQHGNFDRCYLLTSDIDYLPIVESVRRRGKMVIVAGFPDGLAERSAFEYVPDVFIDLEYWLKHMYKPG